jgi:hypothetical protein
MFGSPAGRLYYLTNITPGAAQIREFRIGDADVAYGLFLKGFGEDEDGEIYVCGSTALAPFGTGGVVERIVVTSSVPVLPGWAITALAAALLLSVLAAGSWVRDSRRSA